MPSSRTGEEIITDALKQIGNETIVAEAEVALANIVDRLNEDYRWPFNRTIETGSLTAGDASVDLPEEYSDLWTRRSLKLIDPSNGASIALIPITQEQFDLLPAPSQTGIPRYVLVDLNLRTWRAVPLSHQGYNYELVYKRKPARITDFTDPVEFPNDQILTQFLFAWACQFEDDDRAMNELGLANSMLRQFLKQFNLSPTKDGKMSFRSGVFLSPGLLR